MRDLAGYSKLNTQFVSLLEDAGQFSPVFDFGARLGSSTYAGPIVLRFMFFTGDVRHVTELADYQ